jgi:hypothetical protein
MRSLPMLLILTYRRRLRYFAIPLFVFVITSIQAKQVTWIPRYNELPFSVDVPENAPESRSHRVNHGAIEVRSRSLVLHASSEYADTFQNQNQIELRFRARRAPQYDSIKLVAARYSPVIPGLQIMQWHVTRKGKRTFIWQGFYKFFGGRKIVSAECRMPPDTWDRYEDICKNFVYSLKVDFNAMTKLTMKNGRNKPGAPSLYKSIFGENSVIPATLPLILVFDDKLNQSTFAQGIQIESAKKNIPISVAGKYNSFGYQILSVAPKGYWPEGVPLNLKLNEKLKDTEQLPLSSTAAIGYTSNQKAGATESAPMHCLTAGDATIVQTSGEATISEGILSTGSGIASVDSALDSAASYLTCRVNKPAAQTLDFEFNFISAEFNEYIGSEFDDTAILVISGSRKSEMYVLGTVNAIGFENKPLSAGLKNFPDMGDSYAGESGFRKFTVPLREFGDKIAFSLIISDVGDKNYSSVIKLKNISVR